MRFDQLGVSWRFFVKQLALLVITVVLMVWFTIPLVKTVNSAMNPGDLTAKLDQVNKERDGIQNEIDASSLIRLLGTADREAREKLKKQVEELQRQMALKELENKHLKDEMALVQAMLQLVNAKPAPAVPPAVDFWHKVAELSTKVVGCIGSLFSGGLFVFAWWKTRRKPQEPNIS